MGEWFLGEVRVWACNFAPHGWSKCEGQELAVSTNAALYSLLGNNFGGKAGTTFCLPDLRGRTITGTANASALVGTPLGVEAVALVNDNVAAHAHTINANNNPMPNPPTAWAAIGCTASTADKSTPVGYVYGTAGGRDARYAAIAPDSEMRPGIATISGTTQGIGGGAHNNMAPFLTLVYCIATSGIYPSHD